MPTKNPRTPQQYEQEAEAFIERITRDLEDFTPLLDADEWLTFVRQTVMGDTGLELTFPQLEFFTAVREQTLGFLADVRLRLEEYVTPTGREFQVFRDLTTGRFTSRENVLGILRTRTIVL